MVLGKVLVSLLALTSNLFLLSLHLIGAIRKLDSTLGYISYFLNHLFRELFVPFDFDTRENYKIFPHSARGKLFILASQYIHTTEVSRFTMKKKSLRPGFRFHPTEGELMFYLKRKVMQKKLPKGVISELNIYKYAPWDLPDKSHMENGDLNSYFFCPRGTKYGRTKVERKTEFGHWKSTGQDTDVVHNNKVVGQRKILTFLTSNGDRTRWVMHEYRMEEKHLEAYVLCKIFEKEGRGPRNVSYNEEDYDWGDDGLEEAAISSGLLVPPPSKEPPNSFAPDTCTTLSSTVGCSSASCILENLASTSKEIPQIASGSNALVEMPRSSENFDDGITLDELNPENGNSNFEDGDEFQATVPASNSTDQFNFIFGRLENLSGWSDTFYGDGNAYNPGDQVMQNFDPRSYMELKDLEVPLSPTYQDLTFPDAHMSEFSQFAGLQENIPHYSNEGYNNGYKAPRSGHDWNPP